MVDFVEFLWYDEWSFFIMMEDSKFYVYYLINPETNRVFYVGKGTGSRCYAHLSENTNTCRNKRLYGHIKKMRKHGIEPKAIKIKENLTEEAAYELEAQEIKKYGRIAFDEGGILFNIMEGGSGPPTLFGEDNGFYGRTHTEETRRIIGQKNKGRKRSEEHRRSVSKAQKGVPKSEEQRRRMSESAIGRTMPNNVREKISNYFAKLWIVTLPCGKEILVKNLNKFCKVNNLSQSNMATIAKGGKKKTCKGHKVRPYNDQTDSETFSQIDFE